MEAQDCMKNLIAVLFDFKLNPFIGGYEYHNTASQFTQIPRPQVQMGNS